MIKKYYLQDLNCAHCASVIESQVKEIKYLKNVSLDFMQKTLCFDITGENDSDDVFDLIKSIVGKIEPDVKVSEEISESDENFDKMKFIRIAIGVLIFAAALFLKTSSLLLYLTAYILIGYDVLYRAIKNIMNGQVFDENFLMCLATVGAFIIGEYSEGIAVMIFYQIGEAFQDMAVEKSRKSIKDLMNIRPDYANLIIDNSENTEKINPEKIKIDDLILIKPGEKVPLDSKVIKGNSSVDTMALTGESVPIDIAEGDKILSGSINLNGVIIAKVTKEFSESTVAKILSLVENASSKKSKTENFITEFARIYTPTVVGLAAVIAFIVPLVLSQPISMWVSKALVFLVISCPCALVLSIPLSYFAGIGALSKKGILVKGSNYIEALNNSEIFVFDKTGTLTKGIFKVTEINPDNNLSKDELLEYAAYAENFSSHPIAVSIKKQYKKEIDLKRISNYQDIAGKGISANIGSSHVLAGNEKLLNDYGINIPKINIIGSIVYLAIDNKYSGYIVISDEIKEDSKKTIDGLHSQGIKEIIMLTGDNSENAQKIGNYLGIDKIYSNLLPQDKVSTLEKIISESGKKVAFVGDGINDAPVLTRADVGIAMGGVGSDAAIEASDVVIMNDEPYRIVTAKNLTKFIHQIVYQNIVFSLGCKILFLILGVFGIVGMKGAVFADVGVSLIAILNALRILRKS